MSTQADIRQQSRSHLVDQIYQYIANDKALCKTVQSLIGNSKIKIRINPLKNSAMTEISAKEPEELVSMIKMAMVQLLEEFGVDEKQQRYMMDRVQILIEFEDFVPLHQLAAKHEGQAIAIKCQVATTGKLEAYLKNGIARCPECSITGRMHVIDEIPACWNEKCKRFEEKMTVDESSLEWSDMIHATIQEPIETAKNGMPRYFDAVFYDQDALDTYIGQEKKLVVVYRTRRIKGTFRHTPILKVISAETESEKEPIQPTPEQIKFFKAEMAKDSWMKFVQQSVAPEVLFQDTAKLCILLCIIGGRKVEGLNRILNILLIGDPSEAKTALIKYFTNLPFQKAGYAVGGTASGSGITVSLATMQDHTKRPKAGVVVSCDGGYCGLDELSLFEPEDLDKLRELMQDGELHYDKGGFDIFLKARTTIIAGLNPRWHVYNFNKSILENANIKLPLFSRFQIKINIVSDGKMSKEREIQEHMEVMSEIGIPEYVKRNNLMSQETISLLINWCKSIAATIPTTKEAAKKITDFYIEQKEVEFDDGADSKRARMDRRFSSGIRIMSEAYASLCGASQVTEAHIDAVIELYKQTLRTFQIDPDKGMVQQELEEAQHTPKTAFETICQELESNNADHHFSESEVTDELLKRFRNHFANDLKVHDMWKQFEDQDRFTYKNGRYKLV